MVNATFHQMFRLAKIHFIIWISRIGFWSLDLHLHPFLFHDSFQIIRIVESNATIGVHIANKKQQKLLKIFVTLSLGL